MAQKVPESLKAFLKNGLDDCDDGYEYSSELNRILNSDACQQELSPKEIEKIRDYADEVKKTGEFTYNSRQKVKELELDMFGRSGITGFLGMDSGKGDSKPVWPF